MQSLLQPPYRQVPSDCVCDALSPRSKIGRQLPPIGYTSDRAHRFHGAILWDI